MSPYATLPPPPHTHTPSSFHCLLQGSSQSSERPTRAPPRLSEVFPTLLSKNRELWPPTVATNCGHISFLVLEVDRRPLPVSHLLSVRRPRCQAQKCLEHRSTSPTPPWADQCRGVHLQWWRPRSLPCRVTATVFNLNNHLPKAALSDF